MEITVQALAEKLQLPFTGEGSRKITHACGLEGTDPQGLSYVEHPRFAAQALQTPMQVFICRQELELPGKTRIVAPQPGLAMIQATEILHPAKTPTGEIHATVVRGARCHIGKAVTLGPYVVLGDDVHIGDNTVIMASCFVGDASRIGQDCLIYPNVTIREHTKIGNRVIIQPNSVLGSDGYGFLTQAGVHHKIPQVGYVEIEDDVEIGACNAIDRARFGVTRIGKGSKLDNFIMIAHNVEIGEHALLAGVSGSAGSTKVGHHLTMGGQSMLAGHLTVGNHVTVSAKSILAKSVGDGGRYSGIPAREHKEWLKAQGYLYRLKEVFDFLKRFPRQKIEE